MELHHFFILTSKGAPEADLLTEFGLVEGPANDHPGQGTANRRFFFANTGLELLFVRDAEEARDGPGHGMRLADRALSSEASPFGLIFDGARGGEWPPFPGWRYQPDYFPDGTAFHVGENSAQLEEPLCICMAEMPARPGSLPVSPSPFEVVTGVRVQVPVPRLSTVLSKLAGIEGLDVRRGREHLMDIIFDHASRGMHRDFRPRLPLRIHW